MIDFRLEMRDKCVCFVLGQSSAFEIGGLGIDIGGQEVVEMGKASRSKMWGEIAVVLVVCCLGTVAVGKYGGGSGTPEDPYQIWDANHIQAIGADANDWDKCFCLMTDIDLSGYTYTNAVIAMDRDPTNHSDFDGPMFTGVFDGNNHCIDNLTIDSSSQDNDRLGLFGRMAGIVYDLGLRNVHITGIYESRYVGGLAGENYGIIRNCSSTGTISYAYYLVGGLVGENRHSIFDSHSSCSVSGDNRVGGLVGQNEGTIKYCYSTGSVNESDLAGVGRIGGLVGDNGDVITNSYSTGHVAGHSELGGLVGADDNGSISNCYATGPVQGDMESRWIGGLVGNCFGADISNSYSVGLVSGTYYVGGFVGRSGRSSTIDNCFWDVETSRTGSSGRGIGKNTKEMMQRGTFVGWDFQGTWEIEEDVGYPSLMAFSEKPSDPTPIHGEIEVSPSSVLTWHAGVGATSHDVYFGTDNPPVTLVADDYEQTVLNVGIMDDEIVYYWRVVENTGSGPISGNIWSFRTKATSFLTGTGDVNDPFLIATPGQLNMVGTRSDYSDAHFRLVADIDLSLYEGTAFHIIREFGGVFNGNNHIVSNFTYDSPAEYQVGLFASIKGSSEAEIKNLGLVNVNVTGGDLVGSLVGRVKLESSAHIDNCYVVGGSISGIREVGGLIGHCQDAQLTKCLAQIDVSGEENVGGLVGDGLYGLNQIGDCYAMCNVSGNTRVGGLIGCNFGRVERSFADCTVTCGSFCGGLVGVNYGVINNSYSQGVIYYGYESVGGFAGGNSGVISNCYASCSSEFGYTDGFVGWPECCDRPEGQVENSFWDMDVSELTTSADGGIGKTTAEMQQQSTFENWEFTDTWHICEDISYPRLQWQILPADLTCPYGVTLIDFSVLAQAWQSTPTDENWDSTCDLDGDEHIGAGDLAIVCDQWMEGM